MSVLIIAEAGVNHNGQEHLAFELVIAAKNAGADVVKFQTFKANKLVTETAEQCEYQVSNTGLKETQLVMLSRLELSYEAHHRLVAKCNEIGIDFLSTAFDSDSLSFLVNDLGIKKLKIPSGDLTNAPLLLEHAQTGCELIVSTGMATLAEIEMALGVIAFGYIGEDIDKPSIQAFEDAYYSELGQKRLKEKVTLLHCTTEYPTSLEDVNLKAMDTINNAFKLPVGYSDHSVGVNVPIAAVALGAKIIEKHFTLDKNMQGPDHKASLEPEQLSEMVRGIRDIELALGNGIKGPRHSELQNKLLVRKSIVAERIIKKGEIFNKSNLSIKRPGLGKSSIHFWDILGSEAKKDYQIGDLIDE
ncbi:N-acetylneuraminate synthase [Amylibacter sp.]|nr:N-acetylneuraminate synthase [Amylibacter sp.]